MSSPGAVPGWSTPAAAADLLPPVPWVRPMIRRPLPPQCKMIAVRGEERWEFATGEPPAADPTEPSVAPVESSSPAVEALEQQMEHLAVSSASPSPPTPGVAAAASTASPAKGTPPKKLKQNSSSSSADTPAPAVKSNGKNKQQAKHTESTDGAQGSPSPSISSLFVPPGHTLSSLTTLQLSHVLSGLLPGLEYAATLGSKERVTMHAAAEERGLEHESLGFRPRRHLYVQRKYEAAEGEEAKQQLYIISRMGHVYLEGLPIDLLGAEAQALVDDQARKYRVERDGMHSHCTLVHSSHAELLKKDRPKCLGPAASPDGSNEQDTYSFETELVEFFAKRLDTPIREFGLGRATSGPHTAFFRVLQWPQLNALRVELGLPLIDLHVTVGFKSQDVHGVSKNLWTLCQR